MNGKLIAAARSLLGWSQQKLAAEAGVSRQTLVTLEANTGNPTRNSQAAVFTVLQAKGIIMEETPTRITVSMPVGTQMQ